MKLFSNSNTEDKPILCDDSPCILDASALIAYLEGKPKGAVIQRILEQCHSCGSKITVSALDMLMIYLKGITDYPDAFVELVALLDQLPIQVEAVTKQCALETAKAMLDHQGIQLNTGISLYFAQSMDGTLVTADPVVHNQEILPASKIVYVGDDLPVE